MIDEWRHSIKKKSHTGDILQRVAEFEKGMKGIQKNQGLRRGKIRKGYKPECSVWEKGGRAARAAVLSIPCGKSGKGRFAGRLRRGDLRKVAI